MESCKSETAAKGGWTQQEDRLLLSAAQSARQDGRALRSVFEDVAAQTGRKPNSIRNYYYERSRAMLKASFAAARHSCRLSGTRCAQCCAQYLPSGQKA